MSAKRCELFERNEARNFLPGKFKRKLLDMRELIVEDSKLIVSLCVYGSGALSSVKYYYYYCKSNIFTAQNSF